MLSAFLSWYWQQMIGLLPPSLRVRDDGPPDALIAVAQSPEPPVVEFVARRRRRETRLGSFPLKVADAGAASRAVAANRAPATLLRLPAGAFLQRVVTLPLAAEAGLESVVGFEMDRYTPFTAEEVHWAVTVLSRDRAQGRIQAVVSLVQKQRVAALLEALREIGCVPGALEAEGPGGALQRIALNRHDTRRRGRQRRSLALAGGVCAALALAAAGGPFLTQRQASGVTEQRIASLQPQVAEAETLRRRLAARVAGSDAVAGEQALVGDALQAIAALTRILPDDTYLTTLVLHQRRIELEGQSANAAQLIASLSSDPIIRNAAFSAPVTRAEGGADLFSIRAEVRP